MHLRRRGLAGGAVIAATAVVVLGAAPAQADCGGADQGAGSGADSAADQAFSSGPDHQWQAARWQIGAQLGPAPFALTGAGGVPALLLTTLPESSVAVRSAYGQNLVRVDTARTSSLTDAATVPRAADLHRNLHVTERSAHARLAPTNRAVTPAAAARPAAAAPARAVDRAAAKSAPAQWEVLQADGRDSALGGAFAWVPIEGVAGLSRDGYGAGWATGIGLMVLAGGAAAVTVARRGRISAG